MPERCDYHPLTPAISTAIIDGHPTALCSTCTAWARLYVKLADASHAS
jgi:hypothetical protein